MSRQLIVKCTYTHGVRPTGRVDLKPSSFDVSIIEDENGLASNWTVDDQTICFYTKLERYDSEMITFSGCASRNMNGYLSIDRADGTFEQYSNLQGEWLKLYGTYTQEIM